MVFYRLLVKVVWTVKPPLFRLYSLFRLPGMPNIPDFGCKIRLERQKTGSFSCSKPLSQEA
ncbi:MAG TPA: hypothetical protein DCF33_08765 [Saprospirales bacterium]|nr:hypothetical protein [Saprospirales bacterium]